MLEYDKWFSGSSIKIILSLFVLILFKASSVFNKHVALYQHWNMEYYQIPLSYLISIDLYSIISPISH